MSDQDTRDAFNRLTSQAAAPPLEPDRSEILPVPLSALTPLVRRFVETGAKARGCPPDYILNPLLAATGAVVGDRLTLRIKEGWMVRSIAWLGSVGGPGTGKSPGMRYAMKPLIAVQRRYKDEFDRDFPD